MSREDTLADTLKALPDSVELESERDRAIAALQRARAIGDAGLLYLTTDPMLDPVKETPQFTALASRIGLI